jgi:putative membrane protein
MSRRLTIAFVLAPFLSAAAYAQVVPITPAVGADDIVNRPDVQTEIESIDDGKIIEITHVANVGEIAQAKLALRRAHDPSITSFAKTIISDHESADHAGARVAEQKNLVLAESGISKRLQAGADKTLATLNAKSDADFDRAYVDAQIDQHKDVLRLIDDKLVKSARDGAVKSLLADVRPHIKMHLDLAKTLRGSLTKVHAER